MIFQHRGVEHGFVGILALCRGRGLQQRPAGRGFSPCCSAARDDAGMVLVGIGGFLLVSARQQGTPWK